MPNMEKVESREYIMIDLETLDTAPSALIIQAGIIVFNSEKNLEEVSMNLGWHKQIVAGRTVSRDTVDWHKKKGTDLGRFETAPGSLWSLRNTLISVKDSYNIKGVWSRGSFDIQILRDAGCFPFPYYMERDVRTLDEIAKWPVENTHDALEDCQNQVEHVRSILWNNAQAATV